MDLRIADIDDIPIITDMALKFIEEIPLKRFVDLDRINSIIYDLVTSDNNEKIVFLNNREGMLAGIAVPFAYGTVLTATEVAWWVNPESRNKGVGETLLDVFEEWAKRVGCSMVSMSSVDPLTGKFFEKRGYIPTEYLYIKEL